MDARNEILDAIQILIGRALESTTKIYNATCKGLVSGNVALMRVNGVDTRVVFYGDAPDVNKQYRVFVPEGNMSNAFMITGGGTGSSKPTTPVNADTLQGHAANYFATASGLSAVEQSVANVQSALSGKLDKAGGTMLGALIAQANTNYTTAQVRNIIISPDDPSGGNNGDIWIKYVE